MRMYLSSYSWGNQPERLFEMVGTNKHVALVTNSADLFPEEGVAERLKDDQAFLEDQGFSSERLDLREYFGDKKDELASDMNKFGLVWVRGANVFVLRRAMKQSGFDGVIKKMLVADEIVYGGYSAGACVMGETLRGLELVDDAYTVPERYDGEIVWDGLGLVSGTIVPHFESDHPEAELVGEAVDYLTQRGLPHTTLQDGQAILINDDHREIIG